MVPLTMPATRRSGPPPGTAQRAEQRDRAGDRRLEVEVGARGARRPRPARRSSASSALFAVTTDLPRSARPAWPCAPARCRRSPRRRCPRRRATTSARRRRSAARGSPRSAASRRTATPAQLQTAHRRGRPGRRPLPDERTTSLPTLPRPRYRDADWLLGFTHRPLTSKLSRSSTVSRRSITRASPSRTATTAGRQPVVPARHRVAVRARGGDGEQVAGARSAGSQHRGRRCRHSRSACRRREPTPAAHR